MSKIKSTRLTKEDEKLFDIVKQDIEKEQYGVVSTDSKVLSILIRYYYTNKIKGTTDGTTIK